MWTSCPEVTKYKSDAIVQVILTFGMQTDLFSQYFNQGVFDYKEWDFVFWMARKKLWSDLSFWTGSLILVIAILYDWYVLIMMWSQCAWLMCFILSFVRQSFYVSICDIELFAQLFLTTIQSVIRNVLASVSLSFPPPLSVPWPQNEWNELESCRDGPADLIFCEQCLAGLRESLGIGSVTHSQRHTSTR